MWTLRAIAIAAQGLWASSSVALGSSLPVFLAAYLAYHYGERGRANQHERERKLRAESTMIAIQGEVRALRAALRGMAQHWDSAPTTAPQLLRPDTLSFAVFEANAGRIGEMGSPQLVEHIVQAYK